MEIADTLRKYDAMFGRRPVGEIESFLDGEIARARAEGDRAALFALLNESVGLARNLRKRDKALAGCDELLRLADALGAADTPQYATALLNVGTAYGVFGRYEGAEALFREAETILAAEPSARAYELASLYNNWSLLCVQRERFADGAEKQKRALALIDALDGMTEEKATSRSNVASILLRRCEAEGDAALLDEAERLLDEAMAIYRRKDCHTFHYGTALITLGDLRTARGDPAGAAEAYAEAMAQLERTIGRGPQYEAARTLYERAKAAEGTE